MKTHQVRLLRVSPGVIALALALAASCGGSSESDQGSGGLERDGGSGGSIGGGAGGGAAAGGGANAGAGGSSAGSNVGGTGNTLGIGDSDGDGIVDGSDNCAGVFNPDQLDHDADGDGDPCDPDPPPDTCGDQDTAFGRDQPNVLIVLDKSGSMTDNNKWDQAINALDFVATNLADELRIGLAMFPGTAGGDAGGDNCSEPALLLPVASNSTTEIQSSYDGLSPDGRTPTALALQTVLDQDWVSDPNDPLDAQRDKIVVLITDGQPNCGGGDPEADDPAGAVVAAIELSDAGVPVYVVGFGDGVDADTLNDIAEAGGTNNPSDPDNNYYQANDEAELQAALSSIGATVASCDLQLASQPPDPSRLYVLLDGTPLTRDDRNGWSYNAALNEVTLLGQPCTDLLDGNAGAFRVVFGCPAPGYTLPDGGYPPGTGGSPGTGGYPGIDGGPNCIAPFCGPSVQPCGVQCMPDCPAGEICQAGCCAERIR